LLSRKRRSHAFPSLSVAFSDDETFMLLLYKPIASLLLLGLTTPTLDELAGMSAAELEAIYRQAEPGAVPHGFAKGRIVYAEGTSMAVFKSGTAKLVWKGKHFRADDMTLVNQWCGVRAIRASICYGESWLDGRPAIILDYRSTSRVWTDVRDEMREVAPGLYVGAMYLRRCPEPRLKLFFVLQVCE
jgi:hypothetical protein